MILLQAWDSCLVKTTLDLSKDFQMCKSFVVTVYISFEE